MAHWRAGIQCLWGQAFWRAAGFLAGVLRTVAGRRSKRRRQPESLAPQGAKIGLRCHHPGERAPRTGADSRHHRRIPERRPAARAVRTRRGAAGADGGELHAGNARIAAHSPSLGSRAQHHAAHRGGAKGRRRARGAAGGAVRPPRRPACAGGPGPARRRRRRPAQRAPGVPRTLPALPPPPVPGVDPGGAEHRGEPGIQPFAGLPARVPASRPARLGGHRLPARRRCGGGAFLRPDLALPPASARAARDHGGPGASTFRRARSAPRRCACCAWMPSAARFELFTYTEQDFVERADPRDYGNLDTRLEPCAAARRLRKAGGPGAHSRAAGRGAHCQARRPRQPARARHRVRRDLRKRTAVRPGRAAARAGTSRRGNRTPGGGAGPRALARSRRPRAPALPPGPRSVAGIAGARARSRPWTPRCCATPSTAKRRCLPAASAASSICWRWTAPAAWPSSS